MASSFGDLVYDASHQVLACRCCESCVVPGDRSLERHLRGPPHRLLGKELKAHVAYAGSLTLRDVAALKREKPKVPVPPLEQLQVQDGFQCLLCAPDDAFYTTRFLRMRDHMPSRHGRSAREHKLAPMWQKCLLQTYFTARSLIDYFPVSRNRDSEDKGAGERESAVIEPVADLFAQLEADAAAAKQEAYNQDDGDSIAGNFDSKTSKVPWLERTGFPSHLAGLLEKEVKSSYQLPNPEGDRDSDGDEARLARICEAAESVLSDAYELCSDTSPERKMTQQRANILSRFYDGASGSADGFRYHKDPSTLAKYFSTFKKLLAYYFRVLQGPDGYFTRTEPSQVLPKEAIQHTKQQMQAGDDVLAALSAGNESELKHSVRRLYLALICHTVGSRPYQSVVLSFCAMLSRRGNGLWQEPGNFNSHLSALTWTAQLIIFDYACFHEQEDDRQIPILLSTICEKFFQQLAETPFGHILQWRLYLFKVSKAAMTRYAARWSLDGQTVEYRGLELRMSQISVLVASEYGRAHELLYDNLLFGAPDLVEMQASGLRDNLDVDGIGRSWVDDPANAAILEGTDVALLRRMQAGPELRAMFVVEPKDRAVSTSSDGASLSSKAMAIYEVHAQELLQRLLVLCHITSGQPLREPELLSVTYRNTARPRHLFIWQELVMIHTQYHKRQSQSGLYKDNIRFLPRALGNMILDYIAYVLPLRQLFLRQQSTPYATLSPYLWSKLDGSVWPDGAVSRCLSKACTRAEVPRLHTANWRQIAVSICKEKFSRGDQANFDLGDKASVDVHNGEEEGEEEQELVAMAEQGNHSYRTFNHAYAGSSIATTNALLHRGYKASESWRTVLCFDQTLARKRLRSDSPPASAQMLHAAKRSRVHTKMTYSEADLTTVARRLFKVPNMRLRAPGQRDGLLAMMGPHAAEQVVLVQGTGSGKSLLFMVGASVADAQTTVLILPVVALRQDMLRKCREVGMHPLVWSIGCTKAARLVIVSAEAACTQDFLEYAQRLICQQRLDRIVVDECHLTVTASDYRPQMAELGWYVRQLRTQSVWLTATLPPTMEAEFIKLNKLVRPTIVRESTNRPNIKYVLSRLMRQGSLIEMAATFVQKSRAQVEESHDPHDKMILYCRTHKQVEELGALLGCPTYTSKSGNEGERAVIISQWIGEKGQQEIAATSALGVGFDYPNVRCVVHVGAPRKLTDFSQESGRAGRDGGKALSVILLEADWEPRDSTGLSHDEQGMQLFLAQKHCSRGVLSQFLDSPSDWRWCMVGEEPCKVCQKPQKEARPMGLAFALPTAAVGMDFTGPAEVLKQDHLRDRALDEYKSNLEIVVGSCIQCRVIGQKFDHGTNECSYRFEWIQARKKAYQVRQQQRRQWMERYVACWRCYQPQDICRVADPEHKDTTCHFPDIVMPLCYSAYQRPGGKTWLQKQFGQHVPEKLEDYMLWIGQTSSLEGNKCIQANCIAAAVLEELLR